MPSEVKAFKCDWCTRCFRRICDTNRHEAACNNNPARHHCKTCVHGVLDVVSEDEVERYGGDALWHTTYGPFCNHHNKPIHEKPYFIDCEMDDEGGWGPERPFPGTCFHYEYKGKGEWTAEESKS